MLGHLCSLISQAPPSPQGRRWPAQAILAHCQDRASPGGTAQARDGELHPLGTMGTERLTKPAGSSAGNKDQQQREASCAVPLALVFVGGELSD